MKCLEQPERPYFDVISYKNMAPLTENDRILIRILRTDKGITERLADDLPSHRPSMPLRRLALREINLGLALMGRGGAVVVWCLGS